MEPAPPAVEARSLDHWTTGEVPRADTIIPISWVDCSIEGHLFDSAHLA